MNLLTPAYLLFLGMLLPIILLYFIKPRRRRMTIPSLHIWERMARAQEANDLIKKIKRLISLLLHMIIVSLCAFALARPFFSERLVPQRIVLVLDASTSMMAHAEDDGSVPPKTRFDSAREYALKVVSDLSPEDRLMIIESAARPRVLLTMSADQSSMREVLEGMNARPAPTNLREAINLGEAVARQLASKVKKQAQKNEQSTWANWLGSEPDELETLIYVLSDGTDRDLEQQRKADDDSIDREAQDKLPPNTRILYKAFGGDTEPNVGLTAFATRELLNSPGDHEILATAHNYSRFTVHVRPELFFEGDILDSLPEIVMPPKTSLPLPVSETSVRQAGILELRLMVTKVIGKDQKDAQEVADWKDALPIDDRAFAVVPEVKRKRVLLVSATRNMFLEAALAQDPSVLPERLLANDYPPDNLKDFDLLVLDRFLPKPTPEQDMLIFSVRGQRAPIQGDGVTTVPLIKDYDRSHPVMRYVQLENVNFLEAQKLIPPTGRRWQTLAASFRGPLILAGKFPEKRMVYVAFQPFNTDLVLRKSWPIFVSNALSWLYERKQQRNRVPSFKVGSVAVLPSDQGKDGQMMTVWPPAGEPIQVPVHRGQVALTQTEQVGVYHTAFVKDGQPKAKPPKNARRFTVNLLSKDEGHIARVDKLGFGEETIKGFEQGFESELRDPLFLTILLLLLLEIVLFQFFSVF